MKLYSAAYNGILHNIFEHDSKKYITAGSCQFNTIWIRDSLFCMDQLVDLKMGFLIENLLDLCKKNLKKDENNFLYCCKCFDSENPEWRTVKTSIRHLLGYPRSKGSIDKLVPHMYKDSRDSVAIDTNVLLCMAYFITGKYKHEMGNIIRLLKWYKKDKNGLILQDAYSDFQDSQERHGLVFNINLLYYVCLSRYKSVGFDIEGILNVSLTKLKKKIITTFYDPNLGIFKSQPGKEYICILDNLLVIKYKFISNIQTLYKNLKRSNLWASSKLKVPGFPTFPNNDSVHVQVLFGGLRNYHNDIYWCWLMAFAGSTAFKIGDGVEGDRIYRIISKIANRDECLGEIYENKIDFPLFETYTYSSERPFTMANCHVAELCKEREKYFLRN
jgi:hypothetical protein